MYIFLFTTEWILLSYCTVILQEQSLLVSDPTMSRRHRTIQANTAVQCASSNKPDITHLLLYRTSTYELFGHKPDITTVLCISSHRSGIWQSKRIDHPTEYKTKFLSENFFTSPDLSVQPERLKYCYTNIKLRRKLPAGIRHRTVW